MSWAAVVKQHFAPHEVVKYVPQRPRRPPGPRGYVGVSLDQVAGRLGDALADEGRFHVFSDASTWHTLTYAGDCAGIDDLLELGREHRWSWWHGWHPEARVVINFRWRNAREALCDLTFHPDAEYEARARAALPEAPEAPVADAEKKDVLPGAP